MFWIKGFSPFQAFVEDFLHHFAAFCYRNLCILWNIYQNDWEMNEEIEKKNELYNENISVIKFWEFRPGIPSDDFKISYPTIDLLC